MCYVANVTVDYFRSISRHGNTALINVAGFAKRGLICAIINI